MPEPTTPDLDLDFDFDTRRNGDTEHIVDPDLVAQLEELEQLCELRGWDRDPELYLWQKPVLVQLAVTPDMWRRVDGHPVAILNFLASRWNFIHAGLLVQDPKLFSVPPQAVVLAHEGWGFDLSAAFKAGDQAKLAEYQRTAHNGRVHLHPDRVELRNVSAVDLTGTTISIVRLRDQKPRVNIDKVPGDVPSTMHAFLNHITSTPADTTT